MRLDPDGYEVNCAAARCYIGMRRNQDAIGCLEKAAAAIETDFWALGMAVQCYEAVGDGEGVKSAARRCLERVEKAIVAEPDHGLAIGWGVSALVALHEVDRAKEWTARARLLDPDNTNLNFNLACNMVTLGEFDTALELLAPIISARAAAEPALVRSPTRASIRSATTRATRRWSRRRKRGSRHGAIGARHCLGRSIGASLA